MSKKKVYLPIREIRKDAFVIVTPKFLSYKGKEYTLFGNRFALVNPIIYEQKAWPESVRRRSNEFKVRRVK